MAAVRVFVLTGAGISVESGLPSFRDQGGLWEGHRVDDVATPAGFGRDPALVQRFYDERRANAARAVPNAAHFALRRLEHRLGERMQLVTQNVDDLHERAGSSRVLHLHGSLTSALCTNCVARMRWTAPLESAPPCPSCGQPTLRPDIVWFGEMPHHLDTIFSALLCCTHFLAIGTSGTVAPASAFVMRAREVRAKTIEFNLARSAAAARFNEFRQGPATVTVPVWVDEFLKRL